MVYLEVLTPIDWVVLGLLLVALISGWARGLIRFLTGFVSFLLAVILAGRLTGPLTGWLDTTWHVQGRIAEGLASRLHPSTEVPASSLDGVAIPDLYKQPLAQEVARYSMEGGGTEAAEYAIQHIAAGVTTAICFLALVPVLAFVTRRLGGLFADQVQSIPIVGTADRMLGAAAMGLEAVLIMSFILIWVVPTLSVYGVKGLSEAVGQAVTPPYLVQVFEWLRWLLLGGGIRLWNE